MTLLEAARFYASIGWAVLPLHTPTGTLCSCSVAACDSIGKHPRTEHGAKDATTDLARIERWWRRWPDANVGIATGESSGIWALDQDGEAGEATIAAWNREHGDFPPTPTARTGGGGRHHLFRYVANLKNAVRFAPGMDIRTDGGFIVAPSSRHASGRLYEWIVQPNEIPVADAPSWLLDLIPKKSPPTRRQAERTNGDADTTSAYAKKALEAEVSRVLNSTPNENRNSNLNLAAFNLGQLVGGGLLLQTDVQTRLLESAITTGLPESEARATIRLRPFRRHELTPRT